MRRGARRKSKARWASKAGATPSRSIAQTANSNQDGHGLVWQTAAAIEAELGDAALYAAGVNPAEAATVQTRLDEARAKAAKLTARWEELEAKKSG